MRLTCHGGFGEKGRVALEVADGGVRVLLDCGIRTSAGGPDRPGYYPALPEAAWRALDAIAVTHAHEDHIGALAHAHAAGFRGRVLMTPETHATMMSVLHAYADPADLLHFAPCVELLRLEEPLRIGDLSIVCGRSGHAVGGVWLHVSTRRHAILHLGDVVPDGTVLAMDRFPEADIIVVDLSYGSDDDEPAMMRAAIADWIALQNGAFLIPVPLAGKPLELLDILGERPLWLAPGMREVLVQQISERSWLVPGVHDRLAAAFGGARDFGIEERWPAGPILAHDGMGLSGPSASLLKRAVDDGIPILLTGHVPDGSPAAMALAAGRADWRRLPTHPFLSQNAALVRRSRARLVLGHSCAHQAADQLGKALPGFVAAGVGDAIDL